MRNESKIHGWRIEPREYARQEGRRGRRHAYESIDPARTGLVVIDMVPFFVEADRYAGASAASPTRCAPRADTAPDPAVDAG